MPTRLSIHEPLPPRFGTTLNASLLGTSVVATLQLACVTPLSTAQFVAVSLFSVAVPLMATVAVFLHDPTLARKPKTDIQLGIAFVGWVLGVAGLVSLFAHFHPILGFTSGVVGTIFLSMTFAKSEELKDEPKEESTDTADPVDISSAKHSV